MLVVDMHLRDRYIIVVDGLVRRRGPIGIVVDHLAGMYLRQSHRFILFSDIAVLLSRCRPPHRHSKTTSDKIDKHRNDQAVEEVRKQTAHQRDQQVCFD